MHSTIPRLTCLRQSDATVICRVTYFQFPIQSAFLRYIGQQAAPALRSTIGFDTQHWTSDVAKNVGRYFSCAARTFQGKDGIDSNVLKIKTKYPVDPVATCCVDT